VAGGDRFTSAERYALDAAIRKAEQLSRVEFSVFVGHAESDPRAFAERLHAALAAPTRSILIMVDPDARVLEVVTGSHVRRTLRDQAVELAVVQSDFASDDLVGGLKRGILMLAEHARAPQTLHAEQP
jgi:Domain of unknown function (DUF5130)